MVQQHLLNRRKKSKEIERIFSVKPISTIRNKSRVKAWGGLREKDFGPWQIAFAIEGGGRAKIPISRQKPWKRKKRT